MHVMNQEWRELLFLHWEIDPEEIQKRLPPGLTVDTFEGKAYLGIVPFYMCGIGPSFTPGLPWCHNFLEMNVRTYVYDRHGLPGVWFYSLEANNSLAVIVASRLFHLPYYNAEVEASSPRVRLHKEFERTPLNFGEKGSVSYSCRRTREPATETKTTFTYQGKGNPETAEPGSLNYFLGERYVLFAYNRKKKRLYSGKVHHSPYPLEEADVSQFSCSETIAQAGFKESVPENTPPCSALYSSGVKVRVYALERLPSP